MSSSDRIRTRVTARLAALRQDGLFRSLQAPRGIDLCSNDYLALSAHPKLKSRMIAAVDSEGCGSTGSRLLRGERTGFGDVERTFARFKGTDRSLYFSSGYLANLAVLTTFPEDGDVIFSDERNHASLIDGIRLSRARRVIYPHNSVDTLARLLRDTRTSGQAFVVTESLFSMDGDTAPLAEYAALARATSASLIVDEAHAVGLFGERGSGLIEATGVDDAVFVSVNTAGKALGVSGAFVTGRSWAIEYLVQRARPFLFSTAPPPSVAGAIEAALDLVAAEPERRAELARLARHLRARLTDAGLDMAPGTSHIIPVVLGDNVRTGAVAERLQAQGFDVRPIRPPSVPPGSARLRVTVNVGLAEATLDRFADALATAAREFPQCSVVSS
jgi:8-amino-7-oxononanoate synthase